MTESQMCFEILFQAVEGWNKPAIMEENLWERKTMEQTDEGR